MQNKKTEEYSKMIELQDEIEGECVNNTNFYFDQIGEPLPIKPSNFDSDSDFDSDPIFNLQALPSQPLAVSKLHCLIFVAHSDGFYVARTWVGRYRFRQEPTDEALREKEKKKKKHEARELWMFWSLEEWLGKKRRKEG